MPSDLIAERLRIVTGSMAWTVSAASVIDPNGAVTEPSGSIIRAQDGSVWINTDGGAIWTNVSGLSGSVDSAVKSSYVSLQVGITGSVNSLSGTVNARFLDLTGSLISIVSTTNSSLRAGVTASINALSGTINARFVDVTGSLISSIASTNSSLRAGVTASFLGWPSDLSVAGSITGSSVLLTTPGGSNWYLTNAGNLAIGRVGVGSYSEWNYSTGKFTAVFDAGVIGSFTGSGDVTFGRDVSIVRDLRASGNVYLGNAVGDSHVIYGNVNFNGTPGQTAQILGFYQGSPQWIHLSGVGGIGGIGTSGYIPKWSGQYALGDSSMVDGGPGTQVTVENRFAVQAGGGTALANQLVYLNSTGSATPFAFDNATLEILHGQLPFDTTAAARSSYGIKLSAQASRSLGANDLFNYGLWIDTSTDTGANNYGIYVKRGNVVLGETLGFGGTTVGGPFSAWSDVVLNQYPSAFTTTTIKGFTTIHSGTSVAGSITGSGDVSLGRNLSVTNAISGSGYAVGTTAARLLLGRRTFTADGTYTPTAGTKAILVRMVAGAGGGGGASGGNACGGGGAAGTYFEKFFSSVTSATGSVIVGGGGAAGSTAGGNGATGGDTAFAINTVTYVAKGGLGGAGMTTPPGSSVAMGGQRQAGTSTGDVFFQAIGTNSSFINGSYFYAGTGGSNPLGAGGGPTTSTVNATGQPGTGWGGGGGGGQGAAQAGGSGSQGVVLIDEYG